MALTGSPFGRGKGVMWTDNVNCRGFEKSIEQCGHSPWGDANCDHSEDAGVRCNLPVTTTPRMTTRRRVTTPVPTTRMCFIC